MDKYQNINKCRALDDAGMLQCVRRTLCVWSIHKIRQQNNTTSAVIISHQTLVRNNNNIIIILFVTFALVVVNVIYCEPTNL